MKMVTYILPLIGLMAFSMLSFCESAPNPLSLYDVKQNYESTKAYTLPSTNGGKVKLLLLCRTDCASKCDHRIYTYLLSKTDCYSCLLECMSSLVEQAHAIGVYFSGGKAKKKKNRRHRKKSTTQYASSSGQQNPNTWIREDRPDSLRPKWRKTLYRSDPIFQRNDPLKN